MNIKDCIEYTEKKILDAKVEEYPWRHCVVEDIVTPHLYEAVRLEIEVYLDKFRNKLVHPRGYTVEINRSKNLFPDPDKFPNLSVYGQIINSPKIEKAIKKKVNTSWHSGDMSQDLWTSFDVQHKGFIYDVHSDRGEKIHTMVHYLADPGDDDSLGTTLYDPSINVESNHPDAWKRPKPLNTVKDYVKRAKYLPNTAIIFSPSEEPGKITNHAMFHTSSKTSLRKTLQTFWLDKEVDWTGQILSAMRLK